jgi:predicted alpha/beta hydrolase family esterase
MKILFLHGKESKPGGKKAVFLEMAGHTVLNPLLPKNDWNESVKIARQIYKEEEPDIVVGSSRGGAVAMAANLPTRKMILIAPAWKKYCPACTISPNTTILHSPEDKVISFADSGLLSKMFGAKLIMTGIDHYMNDETALKQLSHAVDNIFSTT